MRYKYFTQKVYNNPDKINLDAIFPEKQSIAKDMYNVSFGLREVVNYLQTATNNFSKTEVKYMDMDAAIDNIVSKYYKSINQENPFKSATDYSELDEETGFGVKDSALVSDGEVKTKYKGFTNQGSGSEQKAEPAPQSVESVEEQIASLVDSIDEQRGSSNGYFICKQNGFAGI